MNLAGCLNLKLIHFSVVFWASKTGFSSGTVMNEYKYFIKMIWIVFSPELMYTLEIDLGVLQLETAKIANLIAHSRSERYRLGPSIQIAQSLTELSFWVSNFGTNLSDWKNKWVIVLRDVIVITCFSKASLLLIEWTLSITLSSLMLYHTNQDMLHHFIKSGFWAKSSL